MTRREVTSLQGSSRKEWVSGLRERNFKTELSLQPLLVGSFSHVRAWYRRNITQQYEKKISPNSVNVWAKQAGPHVSQRQDIQMCPSSWHFWTSWCVDLKWPVLLALNDRWEKWNIWWNNNCTGKPPSPAEPCPHTTGPPPPPPSPTVTGWDWTQPPHWYRDEFNARFHRCNRSTKFFFFFMKTPFYLQSVRIHSANGR
jgi:hypothetical protein